MKLLLDTHLLIWDFTDEVKVSPTAIALIEDERNELFYSTASTWEIAIKHAIHPDRMLLSPGKFIRYCEMAGYRNLPVFDDHIRMLSTIPDIEELRHHDPFDRVLLAQAKAENMLFLTHDSLLARYDEACIVAV